MADYSYLTGTGTGVAADLLLAWAQRKTTPAIAPAASTSKASGAKAPWQDVQNLTPASQLVSNALSGRAMFNAEDKAFSGANDDEKKLFALHAGLNQLAALAGRFDQAGVSTGEQARLTAAFEGGLRQLDSFLSSAKFDALTMQRAAKVKEALSAAAIKGVQRDYLTGVIAKGSPDLANSAFEGALSFHIEAKDELGNPKSIDVDLSAMGAAPRSLTNVVGFINSKLGAAGLSSRFAANKLAASGGVDQYGLKVTTAVGESLSFSAASAAPALYVSGEAGALMKFSDPASGLATSPLNAPNVAYAKTVANGGVVRATAAGADGSLYILADVSSLPDQPIKGQTDAALMKYDSAGNLIYARTLGAASTATGLSLAISEEGRVAIAGAVTGSLSDGVKSSVSGADSFLAVFDENGVEKWTVRSKAVQDDQFGAVAFGADGGVYVAGRGKNSGGDWVGTLAAYDAAGTLRSSQSFGTVGDSAQKIVVQDLGGGVQRVSLAGMESNHAVLRQFEDNGVAMTAGAVRDLGGLGGGAITGLALDGGALYVSGTTRVGGLDAGSVARAYSGGQDGFVAKLSDDLVAGGGDRISYIGGAGDDDLAGMSVVAGQVYFAGDSDKTFAGQPALRDRDGYVGRLDAGGDIGWVQRFSGGAKFDAATFTADASGASALDRFGLPNGSTMLKDVADVVTRTALRVGDEFSISVNGRTPQAVKVLEGDTLQKLADRIERVILSSGVARVQLSASAGDKLSIVASGDNKIELRAGPAGKNALAGLGLTEGVVVTPAQTSTKKTQEPPSYGLGLSSTMSVADKASRKATVDALGVALSTVQLAFKDLSKTTTTTPTPTGPVPAYLTKQLANYQAALARLSAG